MKVLIPILIGLLVVGCGEGNQIGKKSPKATESKNSSAESVKVLSAEEKKIFGEFEYKNRDGSIIRYILLENGALEIQVGRDTLNMSEKETDEKWKMTNSEIHFFDNYNRYIGVFRLNKRVVVRPFWLASVYCRGVGAIYCRIISFIFCLGLYGVMGVGLRVNIGYQRVSNFLFSQHEFST